MSRDDGFRVMDVAVDVFHDLKFRRLALAHPDLLAPGAMVYIAVLGASWACGKRVSVDEGWPMLLAFDENVVNALLKVGLLDKRRRINVSAWTGWFLPVQARRTASRQRWQRANVARLQRGTDAVTSPSVPIRSVPIRSSPSHRADGRQKAARTTTDEDPERAAYRRQGLPVDAP